MKQLLLPLPALWLALACSTAKLPTRDRADDLPPDQTAVGDVVINEVACRSDEYVELANRGPDLVDLGNYAIGDSDDPSMAMALEGTLKAGARASFAVPGLACDGEAAVLFEGQKVVNSVRAPLMPADASYARMPDTRGAFKLAAQTPGDSNAAYQDEAARLFLGLDEAVPSSLPQIRITLDADAAATLEEPVRTWVEGTIRFQDREGSVGPMSTGVRMKGQSVKRTLAGKAALRLDLDRFTDGNHLLGIEKLTLNNLVQDNSVTHERLFYGILTRQGLAGPRVGYVEVFVNDVSFGVYLALESSDEEAFLGRSFPSSELLYEGEYGADLYQSKLNDFDEDYGDNPQRSALSRIISDFVAAHDASLVADTSDTIAWDRVIPQMAADTFCGHFDSYTGNRNNFTLHIDDEGRLSLISGGADQSFSQTVDTSESSGLMLRRCMNDSSCAASLSEALATISDDVGDWLAAGGAARLRADALTLESHFERDERAELDYRYISPQVDDLIDFVEASVSAYR